MSILPDLLESHLSVVFCGTAAGKQSAQAGAYYAGQGNKFWKTLYSVGLTPRLLQPQEYPLLLDYRIGLTDVSKIYSGADSGLRRQHFAVDALKAKLEHYRPRVLAFNGKTAAQVFFGKAVEYGQWLEAIGTTAMFVLPSTSGAASGFWDEAYWRELAEWVRKRA